MTETEIKLQQNEADIARLNEENAKLKAQLAEERKPKERKWIAATGFFETEKRLILNLRVLNRAELINAIEGKGDWVALGVDGALNGIGFPRNINELYTKFKIIFGEGAE